MRFAHFFTLVALFLFEQSTASTPFSHISKRAIIVRVLKPLLLTPVIHNSLQARDPLPGTLQLWSAMNTDLVDHVYSTNSSEIDFLKQFYGFSDEGTVTGYLFAEKQPDTVPLFRLYGIGLTNHFYTTSVEERDHAVKRLGYTLVETVGYVYPSGGAGRVPLYRLHNKGVHDHYYTTSTHQRDDAARNGWTNEGIAGYMFPL